MFQMVTLGFQRIVVFVFRQQGKPLIQADMGIRFAGKEYRKSAQKNICHRVVFVLALAPLRDLVTHPVARRLGPCHLPFNNQNASGAIPEPFLHTLPHGNNQDSSDTISPGLPAYWPPDIPALNSSAGDKHYAGVDETNSRIDNTFSVLLCPSFSSRLKSGRIQETFSPGSPPRTTTSMPSLHALTAEEERK